MTSDGVRLTGVALVAAFALAGCCSLKAAAPEGFAAFRGGCPFRAVSPDGIVYRVRREANDPVATLEFWSEALARRMTEAGYVLQSTAEVRAGNVTGALFDLVAPVGAEDQTYLIALFVRGDDLVIVEAAGEVSRFAARWPAVLAAIEKVELE